MRRKKIAGYLSMLAILFAFATIFAEDDVADSLIRKKTAAYVEAYNRHDAKALAAFWAEDGEYIAPESAEVISGRAAIEESFKARFSQADNVKLRAKVESVTFPAKDEAVAVGTFYVDRPGHEPRQIALKIYFEKRNGDWLIGEIRDIDIGATPDHHQYLKELEWLIGNWLDTDEDVNIATAFKWDFSKNFIVETFAVETEGHEELHGTQIIGWDPIKKRIRSWIFDSDGTFGEAFWEKKGNAWTCETNQTLADGSRASSINVYTPIDANSYRWESTGREVGGKILPDIEPVTIKRKNG